MPAIPNPFKAALRAGQPQIGLWMAMTSPLSAELCAGAGFDWLVIDAEHAPNDLPLILSQLQAVAAYPSHPVVRPPIGETWMIKQLLDIGAQTILVPMIETPEQAKDMVRAMHYPPKGVRGVGSALARSSRFNRLPDYLATAGEEVCLLLQIESRAGLDRLDEIATVDGVDGIFIGPADLAADMGHLGNPAAPEVQEAVEGAIRRLAFLGKPAGILTSNESFARRYLELGATFVAVGNDVSILQAGLTRLAAGFGRG